jgi:hypothetical protein
VRSGDLAGQATSPQRETWLSNNPLIHYGMCMCVCARERVLWHCPAATRVHQGDSERYFRRLYKEGRLVTETNVVKLDEQQLKTIK